MALLLDTSEDVELRLASYLAVMRGCPSASRLRQLVELLRTEPVKQVGSFMASHMTNIIQSDDPLQQDLKVMLQHMDLNEEFNGLNPLTYSRKYEGAVKSRNGLIEARHDSDIIYSPNSFIPRSARSNVTVNVMGNSLNVIEIGARTEGFESYLEELFGTKTESDVDQPADDPLLETIRQKRQLPVQPQGALYLKLFGKEVNFWDLKATDANDDLSDVITALYLDRKYSSRRSLSALDSQLTIPTVMGVPLKLAVLSNAAVDLGVDVDLDLRQMLQQQLLRRGFNVGAELSARCGEKSYMCACTCA